MNGLWEDLKADLPDLKILDAEKTQELVEGMQNAYPWTDYGRLQWENINVRVELNSIGELANYFPMDREVFVVLDQGDIPAVQTTIEEFIANEDGFLAVGFYTWLMLPGWSHLLECHERYARLAAQEALARIG